MPIRSIDGTEVLYHLLCFDEDGVERREADGSLLSEAVAKAIRNPDPAQKITDVFFASHGWKGDVPAAIDQYDRWVGEMVRSPDRAKAAAVRPGFKSIVVGLHWPSLPFGDEDLPAGEGGLLSGDDDALDRDIDLYAASIADTPTARAAIRTILEAARRDEGDQEQLPAAVRDAYDVLRVEALTPELASGDAGAPPGADHEDWDPDAIYRDARKNEESAPGGGQPGLLGGGFLDRVKGLFVAPLQQLSFWKMKDRARRIGESGGHALLRELQRAASADVRFHLMGHSFGCIVVSAVVAGPPRGGALVRPVDSLFLVQGALSLWSYCSDIPYARGVPGYFSRVVTEPRVRGPIVTTRSKHDTAVGKLYPNAAGVARQLVLGDDFPKYGGIGTFGARGLATLAEDRDLGSTAIDHRFQNRRVYNLEASGVIRHGGGFSGAHSDIAHPEVALAMWQAALTPPKP